ncbi:hypothetical protein [Streptomyces sp. CC208A]|uniref:hypothetical protein n=1 Tax=Streptomyces sp. CC208A TaxID=3044573 RepID=UPI0024A7E31D|nr:hypothetical protein [Streptomyces sp. CC208A]
MTSSTGRSLLELTEGADMRGLAAAGLGCLDRCLPLLAADRNDALRPVWAAVARADAAAWGEALGKALVELDGPPAEPAGAAVRERLAAAPRDWTPEALRAWAADCSATALDAHGRYDTADLSEDLVERCRAGDPAGAGPLLAGELRRQLAVLDAVAHGPTGLRRARELSVEGGRVLRAVVSRRARTA